MRPLRRSLLLMFALSVRHCPSSLSVPAQLTLVDMSGIFIIQATGMFLAIALRLIRNVIGCAAESFPVLCPPHCEAPHRQRRGLCDCCGAARPRAAYSTKPVLFADTATTSTTTTRPTGAACPLWLLLRRRSSRAAFAWAACPTTCPGPSAAAQQGPNPRGAQWPRRRKQLP